MNITVLGWYDHGNCGDESYKIAFPVLFPGHAITFASKLNDELIANSDLIILGGGDIVKTPFTKQLYNVNKPKVAASVTITEGSDLKNLKMFSQIVVRDKMSFEIASKHHDNVVYCPDFSFAMTPDPANGARILKELFDKSGQNLKGKITTVVLNSYISFNNEWALGRDIIAFEKVVHELARLCEETNDSWVFLPFSTKLPWDDRSTSAWLANRCKNKYEKNLVIYDVLNPQQILDIIAASSVVVSTRLHSSIFSTIAGIPFVDILHHDKNYGFVQTVGVEDWCTWLWDFNSQKVAQLITEFNSTPGRGYELVKYTNSSREQLRNVAISILRSK